MPIQKLTPEMIVAAILGFEEQKRHIDEQIGELRAMLSRRGAGPILSVVPLTQKRHIISVAARRRIGEARKKGWTAKDQVEPVPLGAPKKRRRLSAAGRLAIIAATKKRWAAIRAAKANEMKRRPGTKKTARRNGLFKLAA
jgi:hypothetical protein